MGEQVPDPKAVWVVHGRDLESRDALFGILRTLGLTPLEWDDVAAATMKASPFIDEVVRQGFGSAQAVIVVLSPEDEARLRRPFRSEDDDPAEAILSGQPRPNVLYEAGMAMVLHAERTILVELGKTRLASDLSGRHNVKLKPTRTFVDRLSKRLVNAGCPAIDPARRRAKLQKLVAGFPDPDRFAGEVELIATMQKGGLEEGEHVCIAGDFQKLGGAYPPDWEPVEMERDDNEHWRYLLVGQPGVSLEYKYVLAPDGSWEEYQRGRGQFKNRTLTLRKGKRTQYDVLSWDRG
jgi:Predicted nucleotide-binding protein containing TIR-like domain